MENQVSVTLIYSDGRPNWFAGCFINQAAADAWVANEQSQPYWDPTTQVQMNQIPIGTN